MKIREKKEKETPKRTMVKSQSTRYEWMYRFTILCDREQRVEVYKMRYM